jgi:hypothetical protein
VDSSDHDSDVITNPHTGAYPAKPEPERNRESVCERDREPDAPAQVPGREHLEPDGERNDRSADEPGSQPVLVVCPDDVSRSDALGRHFCCAVREPDHEPAQEPNQEPELAKPELGRLDHEPDQ